MQRSASKKTREATNTAEMVDSTECEYFGCGEVRSPGDPSVIDDDVTLMLIQRKKAKVRAPNMCLCLRLRYACVRAYALPVPVPVPLGLAPVPLRLCLCPWAWAY